MHIYELNGLAAAFCFATAAFLWWTYGRRAKVVWLVIGFAVANTLCAFWIFWE